jgi:hypothetical protein
MPDILSDFFHLDWFLDFNSKAIHIRMPIMLTMITGMPMRIPLESASDIPADKKAIPAIAATTEPIKPKTQRKAM